VPDGFGAVELKQFGDGRAVPSVDGHPMRSLPCPTPAGTGVEAPYGTPFRDGNNSTPALRFSKACPTCTPVSCPSAIPPAVSRSARLGQDTALLVADAKQVRSPAALCRAWDVNASALSHINARSTAAPATIFLETITCFYSLLQKEEWPRLTGPCPERGMGGRD